MNIYESSKGLGFKAWGRTNNGDLEIDQFFEFLLRRLQCGEA